MIAKEGILAGNIPEMPFYKGNLRGRLQFGASKCGLELDIGNADLKTFSRDIFNTEETEGQFNLKGAFVSRWDNFENARAQGIFSLANCRINGLKFFSETEAGIASVLKGFILPDFKNIEGNFSLKKGILSFEAICSSITATLGINGKISYSGAMEATIATKIIGGSFLKTMRQIIIPISIPFDVIGNSVQVELKGKYPDLKHKARINTMGWLHDFTSALSKSFGRPYTMKDIWKENQE